MRLSETWFIEDHIDFELQKYRLLAYLQEVNRYFNQTKLYPQLSDVIFHYNNLISFRDNKKLLQDNFPKEATKVDIPKLEVVYRQMLQDDDVMKELEQITQYAIEEMKTTIDNGAELYETVEQHLSIEPVGLLPLYKREGYFLLRNDRQKDVKVYSYSVSLFEHQHAKYRGLRVEYMDNWTSNIANTNTQIKRDIVRINRTLPNPAVYCIRSTLSVPLAETLLPIAKRMLVRQLGEA